MSNINEITNSIERDELIPKYMVLDVENSKTCEIIHVTQSTLKNKEIRLLVRVGSDNMTLISPNHNSNRFMVLEDTGKKTANGQPIFEAQGKRVFLLYCVFHGNPSTLGGVFSSQELAMDFIDANWRSWEDKCSLETKMLDNIGPKTMKIYDWSITCKRQHKQKIVEHNYPLEFLKRGSKNHIPKGK